MSEFHSTLCFVNYIFHTFVFGSRRCSY